MKGTVSLMDNKDLQPYIFYMYLYGNEPYTFEYDRDDSNIPVK